VTKEFVTLQLREKDWTFRALDLDQIEELEPKFVEVATLAGAGATLPKAGMQAVAEIAHASLSFKHPDLSVAECRKLITLGTVQAVIEAVRGVSQLDPHPGE
jgi:hypothetical protein